MRNFIGKIFLLIFIIFGFFSNVNAGIFDSEENKEIIYCKGKDCWLEKWTELVKESVEWIATEWTATDKIQEIVVYLLSFLSIVAVLYIIYAWFRIMTSSWDDDVVKNQKKTIMYVIIWILVIRFAWLIANFAVKIWTWGK